MSSIGSATTIAEIAGLIGDVSRASMLVALMDGRALTAGELSRHANVSAATTSGHLAKLLEGRLIVVEVQGRHRYYRLARAEIAGVIETLMVLSGDGPVRQRRSGPTNDALRAARTCYDHLAGRLGVAIADALADGRHLVIEDGAGHVTETGGRFFHAFGIDIAATKPARRPLCRTCLDWSERRSHLSGRLGAAILTRTLDLNWVERVPVSRALRITPTGQRGFDTVFGIQSVL